MFICMINEISSFSEPVLGKQEVQYAQEWKTSGSSLPKTSFQDLISDFVDAPAEDFEDI